MLTPSVTILWDHTTVLAKLVSMETDENALVTHKPLNFIILTKSVFIPVTIVSVTIDCIRHPKVITCIYLTRERTSSNQCVIVKTILERITIMFNPEQLIEALGATWSACLNRHTSS